MDDGFSIMIQQNVPAAILTRADCAGAMIVCPECREEVHLVRASHDGKRRAHLSHAIEKHPGESQDAAGMRRDERDEACTRRAVQRKEEEEALERTQVATSTAARKERVEPQRIAVALRGMMLQSLRERANKPMTKLINDIVRHKEMSHMARMLIFSPEEKNKTLEFMRFVLSHLATTIPDTGDITPLALAWRLQVATDILKAGGLDASNAILVEMAVAGMAHLAADVIEEKDEIQFDLDGDPIDPRHRMGMAIISASQTSRHKAHRRLTRVLHPPRTMPGTMPKGDLEMLNDDEIDGEPTRYLSKFCISALVLTPFEKHAEDVRKLLGTRLTA